MAYAYFLEHEGRLEEALEVLALAVRTHGPEVPAADFAASALFAGRLNRLLARWNEATTCYMSAESAAERAGDRVLGLRSPARPGRGAPRPGQPAARARHGGGGHRGRPQAPSLRDVQAMALTDLGAVYALEGRRVEAVQANYEAFRLTEDALQRMRVLGDLGDRAEGDRRRVDGARIAFELVVGARTSFLVRTNALLELMELESSVGDRHGLRAAARRGGEGRRSRMPPSMLADYHYKAGVGLARFGQARAGRQLLTAGLALAETHRLNAWYFRFEQVLANLTDCELPASPSPPPGRPRRAAGGPGGGGRAPRVRCGWRPSCCEPWLSKRGRGRFGRPGGVAARAGGGGQGARVNEAIASHLVVERDMVFPFRWRLG